MWNLIRILSMVAPVIVDGFIDGLFLFRTQSKCLSPVFFILDTHSESYDCCLNNINRALKPLSFWIWNPMATEISMDSMIFEGGSIIPHCRFIHNDGVRGITGASSGILLSNTFLSIDSSVTNFQ